MNTILRRYLYAIAPLLCLIGSVSLFASKKMITNSRKVIPIKTATIAHDSDYDSEDLLESCLDDKAKRKREKFKEKIDKNYKKYDEKIIQAHDVDRKPVYTNRKLKPGFVPFSHPTTIAPKELAEKTKSKLFNLSFRNETNKTNSNNDPYTKKITSPLTNTTQPTTIKIYDIKPRVYQDGNDEKLKTKYKYLNSEEYIKQPGYGCGLHALKNLIFFTLLLIQPKETKIERYKEIIHGMNSFSVFLHYIEGGSKEDLVHDYGIYTWRYEWEKDLPGNKNWLSVWGEGKKAFFDSPPARFQDTKNLKEAILNGEVIAPNGSILVLNHSLMLGDVNQSPLHRQKMIERLKKVNIDFDKESNDQTVWTEGIAKLKNIINGKKNFVIPLHTYYLYQDSPTTVCRHWVAVILRRVEKESLDVFLIDSFLNGMNDNSNKKVIGTLLTDLGLIANPVL